MKKQIIFFIFINLSFINSERTNIYNNPINIQIPSCTCPDVNTISIECPAVHCEPNIIEIINITNINNIIIKYDNEAQLNIEPPVNLTIPNVQNISFRVFGNREIDSVYINNTNNEISTLNSKYPVNWNILDVTRINYTHTISHLNNGKFFIIDDSDLLYSHLTQHLSNVKYTSIQVTYFNNSIFQIVDNKILKNTDDDFLIYDKYTSINETITCMYINKYGTLLFGSDTGIYIKKNDSSIKIWESNDSIKKIRWIEDINKNLSYWIVLDTNFTLYFSNTELNESPVFNNIFTSRYYGQNPLFTSCAFNPNWNSIMVCMGNFGFSNVNGGFYLFIFSFPLSKTEKKYSIYKSPDYMMEIHYIISGNLIYTYDRYGFRRDFYLLPYDYNDLGISTDMSIYFENAFDGPIRFNDVL